MSNGLSTEAKWTNTIGILGLVVALFFGAQQCASSPGAAPSPASSPTEDPSSAPTEPEPDPTTPNPDSTGTPTPEIAYLTEMEEIHENEGPATINNEPYPRTLRLSLGNCDSMVSQKVIIDLKGEWTTFRATIGLPSDTPPGTRIQFSFSSNGKQIGKVYELGIMESRDVTLDVRGTSLLYLHGVFLEGEDDCYVGDAAWGDARISK
ncbi:NPCBM/NEW2 domain-containing protein [Streptomyces sp. NPDC020731]|uniref:NPCBM/NEW2 domain-containing protein n=1 Tax=Streptomyces sp. NPDC020731 TaxID=3365085 RepID=UPI00379F6B88